jgi:dethiobiotin synthetase
MKPLIVTATDTDVGKTVVSAMLTLALDGIYWKPIQAGTADGTDRQSVAEMTGLPEDRFRRGRYVLREPLSPHRAAELDGVEIDPDRLTLPADIPAGRWLIIEGAGGLLVPLNRNVLQIDLFARWRAPVVLCARTRLGTINHTLLSLEALKHRAIKVLGIVFVGEPRPDNERTIVKFGDVPMLGRVPVLPRLDAAALNAALAKSFDRRDFESAYERQ